jgi:integral membrane sensor domain MASE1
LSGIFYRLIQERKMKLALNIIGGLIILVCLVWFLQGINILPGSIMTGQMRWVINGAIGMLIGAALIVFANWRRSGGHKPD